VQLNDRVLGVLAIALGAFLFWHGHDLEAPFSYEPIGPRAFPMLVATVITLCGVYLAIKGGNPVASNGAGANWRIALMVVVIAAYALLFQTLGFILATALVTIAIGRLFGGRWSRVVPAGLGVGLGFFLLFDRVFEVVLPTGVLGAWS
jgi:putative tricarboxylic transport membrane protein